MDSYIIQIRISFYWSSKCACAATLFTIENVEKQWPRVNKNSHYQVKIYEN